MLRRFVLCLIGFGYALSALGAEAASPDGLRVLDDFDALGAWRVSASDEVRASLRSAPGRQGNALCLDFDFGKVSGYAVARRQLPLTFGAEYEFAFDLRGDGNPDSRHSLQFKLVDASGENVWWVNRPDMLFPPEWQAIRYKKRHVEFAWGPTSDRALKHSAAIEFVVARGKGGGRGSVCFDRLTYRELFPVAATSPVVSANPSLSPGEPAHALDGRMETAWRSEAGAAGAAGVDAPSLSLDFGAPKELGGVVLHWQPGAFASRYSIDVSDDGIGWRTVRSVTQGDGGEDPHRTPGLETRYLRLRLHDGPSRRYALAEIELEPPAYGESANAFIESIAKRAPRGQFPRAYVGEQSYWTALGVDGGNAHGLFSEDGALELGPRMGSIEPFLLTDSGFLSWADVETTHSLEEGYLPIPSVHWRSAGVTMQISAFAMGDRQRTQLVANYAIENRTERAREITLVLALRPFQVNPPTQFLNLAGGVAPIRRIEWDGRSLAVDGTRRVFALTIPDAVVAGDFDSGNTPLQLVGRPPRHAISDETGFASAQMLYRLMLGSGERRTIGVVVPLVGSPVLPSGDETAREPAGATTWLDRRRDEVAGQWRDRLDRVSIRLPGAGQALSDTIRTALAQILIGRDGAALAPGVRAYARSWIRDGAMIGDALLRLGHEGAHRDFIEWYAPYQFANGKVPCCVDARGADPVAENDSQGELIHAIAAQYRHTRDIAWLRRMWPHAIGAVRHMERLRAQERTARNKTPERRAFYGLMPASISHEGYSDRPAYAYWDDFWSLAGYGAAVDIARALGRAPEARRFVGYRDQFHRDLLASIRASMAKHRIEYLPGSADRGDFDATSTTIALSVAGAQASLPQAALHRTFERYWNEFVARRDGKLQWDVYTPYELRSVGAFTRLGWHRRADELLAYFMADRRPARWNQWAEVVGRDARAPRFIGDMPHGWVASDFIGAALDLFAYERASDRALVLAAGVPRDWLAGEGVSIENLRTPFGRLSYRLRRNGDRTELTIKGDLEMPPGGLVFVRPDGQRPGEAMIDGRPAHWTNGNELTIRRVPAVITVDGVTR